MQVNAQELIFAYNEVLSRTNGRTDMISKATLVGAELFINRLFASRPDELAVYTEFLKGIGTDVE